MLSVMTEELTKRDDDLRESERKYRDLFHNAVTAMFRMSVDGHLIEYNQRFVEVIGAVSLSHDEITSIDIYSLYSDPGERTKRERAIDNDGGFHDFVGEFTRLDGVRIWTFASAKLYVDRGYIEGSIIDCTGFIAAQRALEYVLETCSMSEDPGCKEVVRLAMKSAYGGSKIGR